jgi:transcriptional regulator GlxA family with amidase domain
LDEADSTATIVESFRSLADNGEVCIFAGDELPTALLWKTLLVRDNPKGNIPAHAIASVAHALLLSFLSLFGKDEPLPTARRDSAILLRQAKLFIRDNLSQPLTLNGIARYLNVSERHLSRMFSTGIGENFTNYVRDERIRKAATLLASGDLPIKEISEATGFSSVHYFTRVFTQMKEVPPAQYRRKYQTSP